MSLGFYFTTAMDIEVRSSLISTWYYIQSKVSDFLASVTQQEMRRGCPEKKSQADGPQNDRLLQSMWKCWVYLKPHFYVQAVEQLKIMNYPLDRLPGNQNQHFCHKALNDLVLGVFIVFETAAVVHRMMSAISFRVLLVIRMSKVCHLKLICNQAWI